ncbi:uncharacterized protein BX663DRAFT_506864 [Cokeromyces recurvatus]|uniref:uncharacterized protein n=1 Tax=Cokeromyces recurvatus TaxID=90255 RepID=UPI00221ED898|nr:uncharacterized protein BX663DRAFT_506864 [Cokeromyces recurvatus]KAI7903551.1 hypothetical protein BX663DRAFT_506864 [Cokeromyces recurvatus]
MTSQDYKFEFLNLTCNSHHQEEEEKTFSSTHDLAEMMLYAFVDNTPSVADLLWSKQLLQQDDFLKLTPDNQEWDEEQVITFSTHEPFNT